MLEVVYTQVPINSAISSNSIFAHTAQFDYIFGAWRVHFTQSSTGDTLRNTLYIPQTCLLQPDSSDSPDSPDSPDSNDCSGSDVFDTGNVMTCSNVLTQSRASHWKNSVTQSTDDLCNPSISLVEKQQLLGNTDDFLIVTRPLSVIIVPKSNKLDLFARTIQSENAQLVYEVQFRLLIVEFIDQNLLHASTERVTVQLFPPIGSTAEFLLENACTERGLELPRNGMLVPVNLPHGLVACIVRCNWRYISVPWNSAVRLTPSGTTNIAEISEGLSRCVPLPLEFTGIIMHIDLKFSTLVNAAYLSQDALNAVDELALGIQNNSVNVSNGLVVCRVPHSFSAGPDFDFILNKFANELQDPSYTFETRHQNIASSAAVDELLHAECLLLTTDLLEPALAEEVSRNAVQELSRKTQGVIFQKTDHAFNVLLGDHRVVTVVRRAKTKITLSPRINVEIQRITLIALQVVVVLATATAITSRNA